MSFEPAEPISVVTCDRCNGKGCDFCAFQGIYGLKEDQPVVFKLPDFIDFKGRNRQLNLFWLKRGVLFLVTVALITLTLNYLL